jgi:hypothetical protein
MLILPAIALHRMPILAHALAKEDQPAHPRPNSVRVHESGFEVEICTSAASCDWMQLEDVSQVLYHALTDDTTLNFGGRHGSCFFFNRSRSMREMRLSGV